VIRVLIADDENLLRSAIASLLDMSEDLTIVAQASDGAEAVALAAEHDPDVVLLDLEMPRLDGLEAARRIIARRPEQAVVLLTRHARAGVLRTALAAGVRGFLPKSVDPGELERAIVHVHGGRRWIDADISAAAMMDDCPLIIPFSASEDGDPNYDRSEVKILDQILESVHQLKALTYKTKVNNDGSVEKVLSKTNKVPMYVWKSQNKDGATALLYGWLIYLLHYADERGGYSGYDGPIVEISPMYSDLNPWAGAWEDPSQILNPFKGGN